MISEFDDYGQPLISIDGEIKFKCDPQLADTIIQLSNELSFLLKSKIAKAAWKDSNQQLLNDKLAKAVVDLLVNDQNC